MVRNESTNMALLILTRSRRQPRIAGGPMGAGMYQPGSAPDVDAEAHAANGIASSGTTVSGSAASAAAQSSESSSSSTGASMPLVRRRPTFRMEVDASRRMVGCVQFSPELREHVLAGAITLTYRLWTRPQVKVGGRYRV